MDNLSTVDELPGPNVSFMKRFHCIHMFIFLMLLFYNCYHFVTAILYRPAPKDEEEMMVAIFEYIDRIFNIVRPRSLLYMAIDGVVSL